MEGKVNYDNKNEDYNKSDAKNHDNKDDKDGGNDVYDED